MNTIEKEIFEEMENEIFAKIRKERLSS